MTELQLRAVGPASAMSHPKLRAQVARVRFKKAYGAWPLLRHTETGELFVTHLGALQYVKQSPVVAVWPYLGEDTLGGGQARIWMVEVDKLEAVAFAGLPAGCTYSAAHQASLNKGVAEPAPVAPSGGAWRDWLAAYVLFMAVLMAAFFAG